MKIYSKTLSKIVYFNTEDGNFKVDSSGGIERWNDNEVTHQGYWGWVDEDKFEEEEIAELRRLAAELIRE